MQQPPDIRDLSVLNIKRSNVARRGPIAAWAPLTWQLLCRLHCFFIAETIITGKPVIITGAIITRRGLTSSFSLNLIKAPENSATYVHTCLRQLPMPRANVTCASRTVTEVTPSFRLLTEPFSGTIAMATASATMPLVRYDVILFYCIHSLLAVPIACPAVMTARSALNH